MLFPPFPNTFMKFLFQNTDFPRLVVPCHLSRGIQNMAASLIIKAEFNSSGVNNSVSLKSNEGI
jgi:hypothetical protein